MERTFVVLQIINLPKQIKTMKVLTAQWLTLYIIMHLS